MVNSTSETQPDFDDPKNDSQLDELCWQMLQQAGKTRNPGDQIIVGMKGCNLAAVVHFIEPGTGEEYADWLELLELRKARAESAGEPRIPLEQVMAELAREVDPEI
jgi:hypothetical protein